MIWKSGNLGICQREACRMGVCVLEYTCCTIVGTCKNKSISMGIQCICSLFRSVCCTVDLRSGS
jgi:hypothetical protein